MTTDTASSGATAVELRGCARTWPDGTRALTPIDLDIPAGRTAVLLGPSGCGKTTLLRLVAGLDGADEGRISLAGRPVDRDGRVLVPAAERWPRPPCEDPHWFCQCNAERCSVLVQRHHVRACAVHRVRLVAHHSH